jgi:ABC-2 type transport system ATP-binding protein
MNSTISVQHVSKWYGQVVALSDVSCEIGPGVTALVGPNGAGKTTLFKIIAGLLVPSQGTVRVLGQAPRAHPELYSKLGFCPETEPLYDFMTGQEFLELSAAMYGIADPQAAAMRALERVQLLSEKDKRVGAYSRGMRQRLKLAQALVHDPEILLLDEPLLIHRGRLLAFGDVRAIRAAMDDRPHRVLLVSRDPQRLAALLTERALVSGVTLSNGQLIVEVRDPAAFYGRLPSIVVEAGAPLERLVSLDEDLESVFRYLVR